MELHALKCTALCLIQDCLEMRCVGSSTDGLPPGVETIPGPRTQRQVCFYAIWADGCVNNVTKPVAQCLNSVVGIS